MLLQRLALPAAVLLLAAPVHADPLATARNAGCMACHATDHALVGPAYHDIAVRYKGQSNAATLLADKARKGSSGTWGKVPMPPNAPARVSDAEIQEIVAWVLTNCVPARRLSTPPAPDIRNNFRGIRTAPAFSTLTQRVLK